MHTQVYTGLSCMTEYNLRIIHTPQSLTIEKKQQRRRILDAVYERRKQNYQRYIRKLQTNLNKSKIDPLFD